ncbi:predicted protein [Histoplasma capsulatum var. duboisii H88]|uniref:Predicted protein n=1 Tax=Ajellomyces capsulatus (strain H88) TaxID=544711 RepID=F0UMD9_AJEC8|nr:predicted protein [Histoplasma capsulatum var. duboisii H88]
MEGWYEAGGVVDDEGLTRFGAWMGRQREKERKRRAERHDWILMTRLFYNLRLLYLGQHGDIAGWGVLLRFLDHTLSVFNGRHTASNNCCASVSLDAGRNELIAVVVIQPSPTVGEVIRAVRFKHSRPLQSSA